jgi:hypothetical protein
MLGVLVLAFYDCLRQNDSILIRINTDCKKQLLNKPPF